ncbi:MAG: BatA domain-containing protein [Deltaproteobacteria bacterium]|nr:BatA domain-containing protein [Deltaproteobacteria bacterium]
MEFLNPAALHAFWLVPLLVAAYLIRGRPRRVVFSSLLLLEDLAARSSERPWSILRLPPIFFLQLLLLALLIFAMGEPVFSTRPVIVGLVLDTSASMQALEGERSRFELAQEEARNLLGHVSPRARIDLFHTVPAIERVGQGALARADAISVISSLSPYDLGEPPIDYGAELQRIRKEGNYDQLFFITDRPVRGRGEAIRVVTVGRAQDNLAVTSFQLTRSSLTKPALTARVEVSNFSPKEQSVNVSLKGEGRIIAARGVRMGPRGRTEATFEALPAHPYYEAELVARDGLALDNRRFAVAPASRAVKVLGVSPRPEALLSLRSIPGVSIEVIPPKDYARIADEDQALEIFHLSAPSVLPQSHAVLILPPEQNPFVRVGKALSHPLISGWREPHPLTRYINFALFRPAYARPLRPLSAASETIIDSPEGPLALAVEERGFRYVILGFDPLPYLGKGNLPVSIFTLNLLDWLQGASGGGSTITGEPFFLRARRGGMLLTPRGAQYPVREEGQTFSRTYYQGVYQIARGTEREYRAVNFQDARESDLHNPTPISFSARPEAFRGESLFAPLWPYLLLFAVVLFFLEWFFNPLAFPAAPSQRADYRRAS